MDKLKLIGLVNEVDIKGFKFSEKSFQCGAHTDDKTTLEMRKANAEFSDAISKLREMIFTEGV